MPGIEEWLYSVFALPVVLIVNAFRILVLLSTVILIGFAIVAGSFLLLWITTGSICMLYLAIIGDPGMTTKSRAMLLIVIPSAYAIGIYTIGIYLGYNWWM